MLTPGGDEPGGLCELRVRTSQSASWAPPADWVVGRGDCANLLAIVADALAITPPAHVSSILGPPGSWAPPHRRYSEFQMVDIREPRRTLSYLADLAFPSIPAAPPAFVPPRLAGLFWEPSELLRRPDHRGRLTTFPREAWFFVNGILTNDDVAELNAACLADLFHRPITIIQNATSSAWLDLAECAAGKQWHRTTESVRQAFPAVYHALVSRKERVVVVAHSQGTIIMSVVLRLLEDSVRLGECRSRSRRAAAAVPRFPAAYPIRHADFEPLTRRDLAKLEIYGFANCANTMTCVAGTNRRAGPLPWIESFANERDIVARLGMLAPHAGARGVDIAGPKYVRRGAWGHLLNEHYLLPIDAAQRAGRVRGRSGGCAPFELMNVEVPHDPDGPRLFAYLNGGTPPDHTREPAARRRPGRSRRAVRPRSHEPPRRISRPATGG